MATLDTASTTSPPTRHPARTDGATRRTPKPHWLLLVPALALLGVVLLLPLAQSFLRSVGAPDLTDENYRTLFTDGVTMRVLLRTVRTALLVTVIAFAFGYPYAYVMTRVGPRMRAVLLVIVLVPFWTSVMARNFAWILILQRGGPVNEFSKLFGLDVVLYGNVSGVAIAMSQVLLPFMVLPLFSALGGIDRRLLLAARGLGSSPVVAFWKIYWPLSRAGVTAGLILVFTLSLGFYVTPALLGTPQESLIAQLLAQRTTQLLDFEGAGALGMVVLVITLVLVAWANRIGGTVSAIGVVATSGTKEAR
ncbi:ABC transporter permease [Modestobacter versicolor]|uniref:ABC transporter permease n=1 Tax=Modestobacter versicolor TaxID=429133 RepID=A0A323VDV9_9ACTN|nr:ABC transporter permease [Modestobacter versicolor]MBB3674869.1 putative spermidine/putrescine transport system permease protein [Modestobacter versicolor]PZA22907.1 ABC transporter permease [Modestobacter versicolor]